MGNSESTNKDGGDAPTPAQTYNQGPLTVGSHGPVSKNEVDGVKEKLAKLLEAHPEMKEPVRSHMDDVPTSNWRFGSKPDYTLANFAYLTGKKANHADGSLEQVVENLVKTWEMERSHKMDGKTHQTIDQDAFRISANGGKTYNSTEANEVGNYNVLLDSTSKELWDGSKISWERSHDIFHETFAAFPWEVLKVFSGPPTVGFTWRHWGHFTGTYDGKTKGKGELVEMYGFAIATVNAKLQLCDVKIYFDADAFMKALTGNSVDTSSKTIVGPENAYLKAGTCPFKALFG